jgi:cytochrome c oxidase assembly protein subunit 15
LKNKTGALFFICLVWVYLVILAGGTVRATGAGLGCPDWPLCFGQLVPPLSINDLPENWVSFLPNETSENIKFNPVHTWTEYINRLLGATLGILTIFLAYSAKSFLKIRPSIFWFAIGALFSVGFNGWLGSLVVSSELKPVMVSLHMSGAFAVQAFLIAGILEYRNFSNPTSIALKKIKGLKFLLTLCFLCLLFQIGLGIQIRESVDWVIKTTEQVDRANLIQLIPWIFYVHRSFSWIIFFLAVFILIKIYLTIDLNDYSYGNGINLSNKVYNALKDNLLFKYSFLFFLLVCSQMFIGGALNHLNFPIFAQPIHLLVANLLFGLLCFAWGSCSKQTLHYSSGSLKQQMVTT